MRNSEKKRSSLRYCVLSSLFCALIILGAYIRIPFPVPITLQLLFSNTAALLLGPRWGCVPSVLYIACGIAGLPVFSSGGGIGCILSPTFGFAAGFIPGSIIASHIASNPRSRAAVVTASAANTACVYLCGTMHYLMINNLYLGVPTDAAYALSICVLPFLIPDTVKILASILLYTKLRRHIR